MKLLLFALAAVSLAAVASLPVSTNATAGLSRTADRPGQEADGKAAYLKSCKQCHGVLGEPTKQAVRQNDKIPSFTDAAFFTKRSDDSLVAVMKKGMGKDMKSFTDKMTEPEMKAVAKFIRTLPANKAKS